MALSDANIGGTVRVKNSRTQRVIVGTVSDLKKVDVSF
ncbi:MAG: flagella basal body P-ring formation protein FlgA [Psychromonas sp.]